MFIPDPLYQVKPQPSSSSAQTTICAAVAALARHDKTTRQVYTDQEAGTRLQKTAFDVHL
jgi:hypothetical protein